MISSQMQEKVLNIIRKNHGHYMEENSDGIFCYTYYPYGEEYYLSKDILKEILDNKEPMDYFLDTLLSNYIDCIGESEHWVINDIIETIMEDLNEENEDESYINDHDDYELHDFILDHLCAQAPIDEFLDKEYCINIVLDTGDANYDYITNSSYEELIASKKSGLHWLINQQGASYAELEEAFTNDKLISNNFLDTVYSEINNVTSSMNALTFFVNMSLSDLLKLNTLLKDDSNKNKTITIKKCTSCGLVDYWNGAGSLLGIELQNDVVLPLEYVFDASYDGYIGRYGVSEIYGYDESLWNGAVNIPK